VLLLLLLQKEASEYLATCDCPTYLVKAEKRLGEEVERCSQYLDATTEAKITRVVETELISNQVGTCVPQFVCTVCVVP
jgi:cullin 3